MPDYLRYGVVIQTVSILVDQVLGAAGPAYLDIPNITLNLVGPGRLRAHWSCRCSSTSFNNFPEFKMLLDGVQIGIIKGASCNNGISTNDSDIFYDGIIAGGVKVIKIQAMDSYGVGTANINAATLPKFEFGTLNTMIVRS